MTCNKSSRAAFPFQVTIEPGAENPFNGRVNHRTTVEIETGMSVRQFYKAHVIVGIMSNEAYLKVIADSLRNSGKESQTTKTIALHAAELADAMLAEDEEHAKK